MTFIDQIIPALSGAIVPPLVRGTADLTTFAYQGNDFDALMQRIPAAAPDASGSAAWTYDASIAAQLSFRRAEGLNMQDAALDMSQIYRVAAPSETRPPRSGAAELRLLALAGPGDLMTNTPLDFLTNYLNVRLDLLYVLPDRPLPAVIPDHDVAFFALSEADPATLARLRRLYAAWPRPTLNDPRFLPLLARDTLSRSLAGVPEIRSPVAVAVTRTELDDHIASDRPIEGMRYPCLIRPHASHAGTGLSRLQNRAELCEYLRFSFERQFFITEFEEYSDAGGLYRKSRIAFIDREPFLCHMAISSAWLVHYLNAGMTSSVEKRAIEAEAMAGFENGFARRHAGAFEALHERLGFDYYSIDCAETRDGRLLIFEADAGAIVHLMDPPDMFPYKQAPMRMAFAAFDAMLHRRLGH